MSRTPTRLGRASLSALFLTLACATSEVIEEPPADALAADAYCNSIVDFFCPFYLRCERMAVASLDACKSLFLESCKSTYEPRYVALAELDLLSLSREGIAACEEHLATVPCSEQFRELSGPCANMWRGTVPADGGCGLDIESFVCAEGTACRLDLSLCGTCTARVELGGDCTLGDCMPDAACVNAVCVQRQRVGQPCGEGLPCEVGVACDSGECVGPQVVAVSTPCDRDRRCPYGTMCLAGSCQPTARLGEDCSVAKPCESGRCASGKCEPAEVRGPSDCVAP